MSNLCTEYLVASDMWCDIVGRPRQSLWVFAGTSSRIIDVIMYIADGKEYDNPNLIDDYREFIDKFPLAESVIISYRDRQRALGMGMYTITHLLSIHDDAKLTTRMLNSVLDRSDRELTLEICIFDTKFYTGRKAVRNLIEHPLIISY